MYKCKVICLLMVFVMVLSLTACGGSGGSSSGGAKIPDKVSQGDVVEEEKQQTMQEVCVEFALSDTLVEMIQGYENTFGTEAREVTVTSAMELYQQDVFGYEVHALLMNMSCDILLPDGHSTDCIQLMVDLETGEVFDYISADVEEWTQTSQGEVNSREDLICYVLNRFVSMIYFDALETERFFGEQETKILLTEAELAEINECLRASMPAREEEPAEDASKEDEAISGTEEVIDVVEPTDPAWVADPEGEPDVPVEEAPDDLQPEQMVESQWQQFVMDVVSGFLTSEAYQTAISDYEAATDSDARAPRVIHAMEYYLEDIDGYSAHYLMIFLEADVAVKDIIYDNVRILVDLAAVEQYDSLTLDIDTWMGTFTGTCASEEDVRYIMMECYYGFLQGGNAHVWAEHEKQNPLTEAELAAINAELTLN